MFRGSASSAIVLACLLAACGGGASAERPQALDPRAAELVRRLASDNELARVMAAAELASRDPLPASAIPALAPALADPNGLVRAAAARTLGRIGPAALPALGNAMRHPDWSVRASTRDGFLAIGPKAAPFLLAPATVGDHMTRTEAYHVLVKLGPAILPSLIEGLKSPNAEVRRLAAEVLCAFKGDTHPAIPALVRALGSEGDSPVVLALTRLGPDVVAPLIAVVSDPGRGDPARTEALYILSTMKPPRADVVPALRSALSDGSAQVRFAAAVALAEVDPASRAEARKVLTELAKSTDERLRLAAGKALGSLGSR